MVLSWPYECEINNREEAVRFLQNKCSNCHRYPDCSGVNASKCNDVVAKVIKEFGIVKVNIDLPDYLTSLAGNDYGREIFDTFVEPKMNKGKIIVIFPDSIERVAVGFVQGFIYKIGAEKFKEQFEVQGSPEFVKGFMERLD